MLYYLNGINAINLEWLKGGCEKPMEEIAEIIKVCILGLNSDLLNQGYITSPTGTDI